MGQFRMGEFQSPRGDFGFLKLRFLQSLLGTRKIGMFQSPRGDFGFLKSQKPLDNRADAWYSVSIPSRGFWFFEERIRSTSSTRPL